MTQTSVEWFLREIGKYMDTWNIPDEVIEKAYEMHKEECIAFAEQWELRCNEKNMDSKEQLYEETYNK
jgi:hypothetical protein